MSNATFGEGVPSAPKLALAASGSARGSSLEALVSDESDGDASPTLLALPTGGVRVEMGLSW